MNTRNIKIDTISKTITFEKSVTSAEIRQLISDLHNYNIVIQEPIKEEGKTASEILEILKGKTKPSEFKDFSISIDLANPKDPAIFLHHNVNKPLFDTPICSEKLCFCSGKCKTKWASNNSNAFRWNLNGR